MVLLEFFRGSPEADEKPIFRYRLRDTRTRIGRTDDCDVVLPDDEVSRSHAVIDQSAGTYFVIDRSSNGTFVNGERADRTPLSHGDLIKIGPFVVRVDMARGLDAKSTENAQPEARDEEIVDVGFVAGATLVVVAGPAEGKKVRLRGGTISVGGAGSRVALSDPSLVRDHVRVRLMYGRAMVEPGHGGAFVGGMRVRDTMPLYPEDEVRVGATIFRVEWTVSEDRPTSDRFGEMVAVSKPMQEAFGLLRRMAAHPAPILLLGESGTGKELAARAIHDASPRVGGKFVAVNCGAISPLLFESELFGHEKGSFTGADARRDGAFQRADGGTLFLDEIGELPEDAQVKLLRALETGEIRRVGGAEPTFPDVRVVAATNRVLSEEVKDRRFRPDLYFRLAVLAVRLPALRERPEDIPIIARAIALRLGEGVVVSDGALEALAEYTWPGNARELRNVLTRAFVLGGPRIEANHIAFNAFELAEPRAPSRPNMVGAVVTAERDAVNDAMRKTSGNRSEAARLLGIPRSSLLYKLRRLGLEHKWPAR